MKNTVNRALLVLFTLTTMAPAFGMSALKRGFMGYQLRKAAYGTLTARLFRSNSTLNQGFKATQRPATLPVQPAVAQPKVGFFKFLASIPVIGWFWQSDEEKLAKQIVHHKAIKNSLTSASWNPNHPIVSQFVYEKCRRNKLNATECGMLYKNVQEQISKERLRALDILTAKNRNRLLTKEEELQLNITSLANDYTEVAMRTSIKENGKVTTIAQASDEQIHAMLSTVEKDFSKCTDKETRELLCNPARVISFQQLRAFRDSVQGVVPVAPTQAATPK